MEKFGPYLRAEREKKGIRLEEIASITKIHLHNLELLEASDWKRLPPEPFIRGFIIAYAKYVGVDPKEAVRRYLMDLSPESGNARAEVAHEAPVEIRPQPTPQTTEPPSESTPSEVLNRSQTFLSKKHVAFAGVIVVVAVIGAIISVGKRASENIEKPVVVQPPLKEVEKKVEVVAPPPPQVMGPQLELQVTPNPTPPTQVTEQEQKSREVASKSDVKEPPKDTPASAAPTPSEKKEEAPTKKVESSTPAVPVTASPKVSAPTVAQSSAAVGSQIPAPTAAAANPVGHEVVIEGTERTWIKVVVDDNPPKESFLGKGEKGTYQAKSKIKVVLGNATAAKVTHNGEEVSGKKLQGTIRSYIFPPKSRFPQDIPKRATASEPAPEKTEGSKPDGALPPAPDADSFD